MSASSVDVDMDKKVKKKKKKKIVDEEEQKATSDTTDAKVKTKKKKNKNKNKTKKQVVQTELNDEKEMDQLTDDTKIMSLSAPPTAASRTIDIRYMTIDKKFSPLETLKIRSLVTMFRLYHSTQYHYEQEGHQCELEVRLGRCHGQHFEAGVDRRMFETYMNIFLKSQIEESMVYEEMPERVVTYYANNIRSTDREQKKFEVVKRFSQMELKLKHPFMDLRINLKDETPYNGPAVVLESWTTQRLITRHRFSCTKRGIQIDLSTVKTTYNHSSQQEKTTYEIEMELLPCPHLSLTLLCYNRAINMLQLYGRQLDKTLKAMELN